MRMRAGLIVAGVFAALLAGGCAAGRANRHPFPPATPEAVVEVTRLIFPAVVRIDVKREFYERGKRQLRAGIGSGVIVDDQGRILTNYHVAGRSAEIYVTLENKERVRARLVGDDHWTDLAVLQMDMEEVKRKGLSFRHAQLGTSRTLVPGQDVMAVGTPFGLARTLTLGVVSNTDRTLSADGADEQKIDGMYETGIFYNWIQMDTPINPGNSGGPLVDLTGKVVGINTRGGGQNLNFAIPIDIAAEVLQKILATAGPDRKGRVERSDLGISFKPLHELEQFYGIDINTGALINSVDRGSTAMKNGVHAQDILLEINGQPVNARFPEELAPLRKRIADLPVGSNVTLKLRRGKDTVTVTLPTEKLQSAAGEEAEARAWGLSVRDVTRAYANEKQLDDENGVVVTSISPGFAAAKADLQEGDVIRAINEKPVTDLEAFLEIYRDSTQQKQQTVLVQVQRGRTSRPAVMKVSFKE